MCHVERLLPEQRNLLATLSRQDRWRLNKILEDGSIPSKSKPVRAVFERFIENKHLTVAQAEEASDLALSA